MSLTLLIRKEADHWAWTATGNVDDDTKLTGKGTTSYSDKNRKSDFAGELVVGGERVSFVDPYTRVDD